MPKSREHLSTSEESDSGSDIYRRTLGMSHLKEYNVMAEQSYKLKKMLEVPKAKKKKVEKAPPKKEEKSKDSDKGKAEGSKTEKGPNGELMFQLSRMRYATVSDFRGKILVSVREYYEKDGNLLPGKKGISLSLDQWNALKDHVDDIDEAVRKF